MKITVDTTGIATLKLELAGLGRKVAVATKAALNDAAYLGSKKTAEEVAKVFDRPTPWVKGSVRYKKASADKLEASIDFDRWGNKTGVSVDMVLAAQIAGGKRKLKRHEVALQRMGILPAGMAIVPGAAAQMDQYGNMSSAQIRQILSWFNAAEMTSGYTANMSAKRRAALGKGNAKKGVRGFEYFYVAPGSKREWKRANGKTASHKMQPGIYQRIHTGFGSAIRPVMIFVKVPAYAKRLPFYELVDSIAAKEFNRAFAQYIDKFIKERGL